MKRRAGTMSLIVCLLFMGTSCAQHSFKATWYMVKDGSENKPSMYVVILNRSAKKQFVKNVILNPMSVQDSESGWQLGGPNRDVEPGEVISRPITDFKRTDLTGTAQNSTKTDGWVCRVPLRVKVVTESRREADLFEISGDMPSALPYDWEHVCPKR